MSLLKNKTIGLDFGHGGKDSGAIGYGKKESDFNLQVGMLVAHDPMLKNCKIVTTRTNDTFVSLADRVNILSKCDIVISIHGNSFVDKNVGGVETLTKGGPKSKSLASKVQENLVDLKLFNNRGIKIRNDLYILNGLHRLDVPVVLTEIGFISNYKDNNNMFNNQKEIANSLVKSIYSYFKVDYDVNLLEVKNVNNKFYRVIAGSYTDRENAEKMILELKKKGINSFIDIYYKR